MTDRICFIEGCSAKVFARGWCSKHYTAWSRFGDPLAPAQRIKRQKHIDFDTWVWSFVDKSAGLDACWPWMGPTTDKFGYGQVTYKTKSRTKAHRAIWIIVNGDIPEDMVVRHRCDNPPCCNPAHLLLGTQADNLGDMWERERGARGESNGHAKLTEQIVRDMRARHAAGESARSIAISLGINPGTGADAIMRRTWKHVE